MLAERLKALTKAMDPGSTEPIRAFIARHRPSSIGELRNLALTQPEDAVVALWLLSRVAHDAVSNQTLLACTQHRRAAIRAEAARSLALRSFPGAAPILSRMLRSDPDEDARVAAA